MGLLKRLFGHRTALPPDASATLRRLLEKRIRDEKGLREVALRYHQLHVEHDSSLDGRDAHARHFDYERDMRVFLIRKAVSHLYGAVVPSTLIECGSAGDISAALALPDTAVTAVDIDPAVFINEVNRIPQQWFDAMGLDRIVAFYCQASQKALFRQVRDLIDACLPNYRRVEGDGEFLREEGVYDVALVQGTPDMLGMFKRPLARALVPGGYLVSIVMEEGRLEGTPSFYETGVYASWPDCRRTDPQKECLPLTAVPIPDAFKRLETACSRDSSGTRCATGFVFEIYQKT